MNKKLITAAAIVTVVSSTGKILGLIRESCLAAFFGMSRDTDAFKIAFSIPDIFITVICAAITQVFIPIYSDILKEKNPEKTIDNNTYLNSLHFSVEINIKHECTYEAC